MLGLAGQQVHVHRVDRAGRQILEHLERANLFIVPLDRERRWYRYHRLFSDLLRSRLQQARPDLVRALHRRASAWYEQSDLLAEAIAHALPAQDLERAANLAEQAAAAAEDAKKEVETQVEQGKKVVNRLAQGLQNLNEQVNTFKSEASEAVQAAQRTFDLVLDGDEEAPAPAAPAIDTQKLDQMSADIDALLQVSAEWSG